MTGGTGNDTFRIVDDGSSSSIIRDFTQGQDLIQLASSFGAAFEEIMAGATQNGSNTDFHLSDSISLNVVGLTPDQFTVNDFLLV